jgi:hypothetical protein
MMLLVTEDFGFSCVRGKHPVRIPDISIIHNIADIFIYRAPDIPLMNEQVKIKRKDIISK